VFLADTTSSRLVGHMFHGKYFSFRDLDCASAFDSFGALQSNSNIEVMIFGVFPAGGLDGDFATWNSEGLGFLAASLGSGSLES